MKTVWTWLKRAGSALVALIAILFFVNTILIWINGARLEARLNVLREAGEPLCLQDLAPKGIPDEENAAIWLRRAKVDVDAAMKEIDSIYERIIDSDGNDQRTDADSKAIRTVLEAYPKLFAILEKAAACTDYQSGLDYSVGIGAFYDELWKKVQPGIFGPIHILNERVRLQIAEGKRDEALGTTLVILRISQHLEREPILSMYPSGRAIAVDAANRVLRSGPVSAKASSELEAEFARANSNVAFERYLKSERACGLEQLGSIARNWKIRAYFNDEQCYYLDMFAALLAITSKPYKEAQPAFQRFFEENESSWRHRFALPNKRILEKTHEFHTRSVARLRCLRVLNALHQKSLAGDAASIRFNELGLPAEATTDPYNGSPLLIRKTGQEWIVYCVGTNLVDDGGVLENHKDVGVGPIDTKK